jgi:hypothetical protein
MMRAHLDDGRLVPRGPDQVVQGGHMWWGIGFGVGILWLVLMITLGLMTLRNGHGWLFFFGIFFPLLWIFGAVMKPRMAPA